MANFEVVREQRPGELVVRLSGTWTSLLSTRLTSCWRTHSRTATAVSGSISEVWSSSIRPGSDFS